MEGKSGRSVDLDWNSDVEVAGTCVITHNSGTLRMLPKARYGADIERGWLVDARRGRTDEVARVVSALAQGLPSHTVRQAVRIYGAMLINEYRQEPPGMPSVRCPSAKRRPPCAGIGGA